jgi:hypothetical protein
MIPKFNLLDILFVIYITSHVVILKWLVYAVNYPYGHCFLLYKLQCGPGSAFFQYLGHVFLFVLAHTTVLLDLRHQRGYFGFFTHVLQSDCGQLLFRQ